MDKVELLTCESGDWEVLKVNDELHYEGHSIPNHIWLEMLGNYFSVKTRELSDENMELRNFGD